MKDERLVHRLEAFSDIVIGFVLAEMAIMLAVPKDAPTFSDLRLSLAAFAGTFGLVAVLWYMHNRLFAYYFVANFPMIFLNFVMLGCLVVMGYLFGLALHFADRPGWTALFGLWFFSFAAVYALMGAMYGLGAYLRRAELSPELFAAGVMRCGSAVVVGVIFIFLGYEFARATNPNDLHLLSPWTGVAIAVLVLSFRVIGTRWLASRRAASRA